MFTHTIKVPTVTIVDGEDGNPVEHVEYSVKTFVLKGFGHMPGSVSKDHRGDAEGQMWAAFEWGLSREQFDDLGVVPLAELEKMLRAWQADAGLGPGE